MVSEQPELHLAQMQFLTVAEVASMMRVSKMTVYRLVHSGELPAARVGGRSGCPGTRSRATCAAPTSTPGSLSRPRRRKGCLHMGSVIKKRRKRMSKKKHRKLLRKTRVQRRKLGK
jgi:excisionase family DNA binding protein